VRECLECRIATKERLEEEWEELQQAYVRATNDLARAAGNGANACDTAFSECTSALERVVAAVEKVANELQFLLEVAELKEWRMRWGKKEQETKKGVEKN
jgi:hypothetical protein